MSEQYQYTPEELDGILAENDKLKAEASALRAREKKELAEADYFAAQAEHERAQTEESILSAEATDLEMRSARRKEATYLAGDYEHRVYRFGEAVNEGSVNKAIATLSTWSRLTPGCDIKIIFNSPGGNVISGMDLFDHIEDIRKAGHHVTTKASGYAASMAGILLQSGDVRVMAKESWLLIHRGSATIGGSMGDIEDYTEWFKKVDNRILDIFYTRSHATDAPKKLSRNALRKSFERRDWWLSSDDALSHGFIDRID